jgi:hypothetical protein
MNDRSAELAVRTSRHESPGKSAEFGVTMSPRVERGRIIVRRRGNCDINRCDIK